MPLQTKTKVSKVQLRAGEEIKGAFLFVGDKSTNNGMDNKACAIVSSTFWQGAPAWPLALLDTAAHPAWRSSIRAPLRF